MMIRLVLIGITFLILVSEGVALELLPTVLTSSATLIVPHWLLVFLVLINLFYDTNETYFSIYLGIVFGLLIDIVYTGILGAYMFTYPFTLYLIHLLKRFVQSNLTMSVMIVTISIVVTEVCLYVIYFIIGLIHIPLSAFSIDRLLPTVLANIIFFVPLYFIFKRRLEKWRDKELDYI